MGFGEAETDVPIQSFKLTAEILKDDILVQYVKFQLVDNLSVTS